MSDLLWGEVEEEDAEVEADTREADHTEVGLSCQEHLGQGDPIYKGWVLCVYYLVIQNIIRGWAPGLFS